MHPIDRPKACLADLIENGANRLVEATRVTVCVMGGRRVASASVFGNVPRPASIQRLAPSQANLERLSELIAANERDERCELMWGSPGTILAGRELGLDVTASIEWLHGRRDTQGLWTQQLYGKGTRYLGPAHGFAGCVLALGDVAAVSETLQRFAVEEDGLVNWPPACTNVTQGRFCPLFPKTLCRIWCCSGT